MPSWLIGLIMSLGLPALKMVLKAVLLGLEKKYPGIAPLVDAILKFLEQGGQAHEVLNHCQGLPGFCPLERELKRD